MGPRKITLRKDGPCVVCARPLTASSQAWWDDAARTVTCPTCARFAAVTASHAPLATATPSRPGPATPPGAPPVTRPGAVRLASRLRRELAGRAVVLDHRRVPRTKRTIDHLVIATSGVWIVDAAHHTGKVVHRDVGSYLRTETRLFVDGLDCTALVTALDAQVSAVREELATAGFAAIPVRPVLCFTNPEWGPLAKPFAVNGVLVTWANKLCGRILDGPPTHPAEPMHLAALLGAALPTGV